MYRSVYEIWTFELVRFMAKTTIIFGVLLIGLGIVGYSGGQTETVPAAASSGEAAETSTVDNAPEKSKSVTALIPAFVGIALAACGLVALLLAIRRPRCT